MSTTATSTRAEKKRVVLVFPQPGPQKITWTHAAQRYAHMWKATARERQAIQSLAVREHGRAQGNVVVTVGHVGDTIMRRSLRTAAQMLGGAK